MYLVVIKIKEENNNFQFDNFYQDLTKKILASLENHKFENQLELTPYLPKEKDFEISKKFVMDWSKYNKSQMEERILFMRLLRELCDTIEITPHKKGRKPADVREMIYSLALKTYQTHSSRRSCGELKLANKAGFVNKAFHFNTLLKYLDDIRLKPLLQELIEISALPLKQVELDFADDSTGFSTSIFGRWFDVRIKKDNTIRKFRKCHSICGVKINIVTAAEVSQSYSADINHFQELVEKTANNFQIREVSADKAYLSKENLELVSRLGGIAYIPFKSNTSGKARGSMLWVRMFEYFTEHKEEFLQHYHKRSNIESTFSMIKKRFGASVRCKKIIGQDNEILLKVLCHNICVLIQEIFLNNIDVNFQKCAEIYIAHN